MIEILKYTLPALIVFGTVYVMLNQHFRKELAMQNLEFQKKAIGETLPIKIQAYERLILFCDRVSPQAMIFRLNQGNMTVGGLRNSLLLAIQKEFEHNVAQQIYISDKLWEVIETAKAEAQQIVIKATEGLELNQPAEKLITNLSIVQNALPIDPMNKAKAAIKEEVQLLL